MKINEVEQQVGITKKNIRFYEQQGLLNPKRNMENGYRDYTPEDIAELKKIKLLRKLSLPIEEIRKIQHGDLLLEDALQRQLIVLERERINLQETSGLCHSLMEDNCKYLSLIPDEYLERMVEMEKEGTKFANVSKNDIIQKKRGSMIAAGTFIIFMVFLICVLIWGYLTDPIPLWIWGVFVFIPVAVIMAVIVALVQRIKMLLVNTDYITGKELETLGIVKGSIVQTKNFGKDFMAGIKTLVGGEVKEYTDMLNQARQIAVKRMVDEAQALGADAVVNVRYASSSVMQGAAEVIAYGTAVKYMN